MSLLAPRSPGLVAAPDLLAEALFEEARRRRRRRRLAAASALAVVLTAAALAVSRAVGASGGRRPATATLTPAGFLAKARGGEEGTFQARYRISSGPNPRNAWIMGMGPGTVMVAQRAAAGSSIVVGRTGTWSYLYRGTHGPEQWIERGSTVWDCASYGKGLECSGPGTFFPSNGFFLAVQPFVPASAIEDIAGTVGAAGSAPKSGSGVRFFSEPDRAFGTLSCMTTPVPISQTFCLDSRGVLVSYLNPVDVEGMRWMKVSLVSWSPAVPGSDFRLLAKSHSSGRFLELPPIG
jgi:hypothetical protein